MDKTQFPTKHAIDRTKRTTLKKIGATAGLAATASAAGNIASATAINTVQHGTVKTSGNEHHLTINIQKNRDDLDDWVLLENMTESPLTIRSFEPRFVRYDNTVLDLHALLSRQQKGKHQLEVWPSHAWTHSTRGATRSVHALRPVASHNISIDKHSRSVQITASVTIDGQLTLLS